MSHSFAGTEDATTGNDRRFPDCSTIMSGTVPGSVLRGVWLLEKPPEIAASPLGQMALRFASWKVVVRVTAAPGWSR
jgi:hypothetical protein